MYTTHEPARSGGPNHLSQGKNTTNFKNLGALMQMLKPLLWTLFQQHEGREGKMTPSLIYSSFHFPPAYSCANRKPSEGKYLQWQLPRSALRVINKVSLRKHKVYCVKISHSFLSQTGTGQAVVHAWERARLCMHVRTHTVLSELAKCLGTSCPSSGLLETPRTPCLTSHPAIQWSKIKTIARNN